MNTKLNLRLAFFLSLSFLIVSCADAPALLESPSAGRLEPAMSNLSESSELSPRATLDPKATRIIADAGARDGKTAALYRSGDAVRFELANIQSGAYKVSVRGVTSTEVLP